MPAGLGFDTSFPAVCPGAALSTGFVAHRAAVRAACPRAEVPGSWGNDVQGCPRHYQL